MSLLDDDATPAEVEMLVLTIKECFVYKVPPLKSASGHRAEEWGLDNPIFTGCLQFFQADRKLRLVIYSYKDQNRLIMDAESITPFGQCPIEIKAGESITNFVDGVVDSSRYYVVRLKDPMSNRWVWIGAGFRDRETAFDFKTALNEYVKYIDRCELASKLTSVDQLDSIIGDGADDEDDESRARKSDHRSRQQENLLHLEQHIEPLKEGEKIKVNIKGGSKSHPSSFRGSAGSGGGFTGLKPPPQPGSTVFGSILPSASSSSVSSTVPDSPATASTEDDDWGDFIST
jgi:hypothetical protein